jgi:Uma2 family endonuclease
MLISMGTTTLMSFAEFEQLPSGPEQLELLKGELIQLPPAQNWHMDVSEGLYQPLLQWRQANPQVNAGRVHIERGYLISTDPPSWLQPDVSVTHANQPGDRRYYEGAPLIVFEVVSEYDTAAQLQSKVRVYLANGAKEVWVLYPASQEAWVYREYNRPTLETEAIRSELLPGLTIPLSQIFQAGGR